MLSKRLIEKHAKEKAARKAANLAGLCTPSRAIARGSYGGTTAGPAPKSEPYRDPALLEMARGRPCLLMVPAVCTHRVDQTVACHQNEGKGMGMKQSDAMSAWGCAACHVYYDRSGVERQRKRDLFMAAHARQVLAWRLVAMDTSEPERFRNAARRALEHLNATPLSALDEENEHAT